MTSEPRPRKLWLFSAPVDLAVFLGSALLAVVALLIGAQLGLLEGSKTDSPEWTWVTAILLIDVAHVWATGFRVYFVPETFRRRSLLYLSVPIFAWIIGIALYSESSSLFWRVLAYVAVFHFVRQQYGWVALYRARAGERDKLGKWIDSLAIYLSMLYPLIWWHAHLPRRFWWFLPGDFVSLPTLIANVTAPLYWASLVLYFGRSLWLWAHHRGNPGKDIIVITTAFCWHVGIITFNSDYAFTVTNVIIHGIPYIALIWWLRLKMTSTDSPSTALRWLLLILSVIWVLAFVEEMLWDRGIWHERGWLFGESWSTETLHMILVPLLAVPQVTHYILDGFIWRRRSNPELAQLFR